MPFEYRGFEISPEENGFAIYWASMLVTRCATAYGCKVYIDERLSC